MGGENAICFFTKINVFIDLRDGEIAGEVVIVDLNWSLGGIKSYIKKNNLNYLFDYFQELFLIKLEIGSRFLSFLQTFFKFF